MGIGVYDFLKGPEGADISLKDKKSIRSTSFIPTVFKTNILGDIPKKFLFPKGYDNELVFKDFQLLKTIIFKFFLQFK